MKMLFQCGECGKVFDKAHDCREHELWCLQQRKEDNAGDGMVRLVKLTLDLSEAKPKLMRQVFDVKDCSSASWSPATLTVWHCIAFDGVVKSSTEDPRKALYTVYFDTRRMAEETARLKLVQKAQERLIDMASVELKFAQECTSLSQRVKDYDVVEVRR